MPNTTTVPTGGRQFFPTAGAGLARFLAAIPTMTTLPADRGTAGHRILEDYAATRDQREADLGDLHTFSDWNDAV